MVACLHAAEHVFLLGGLLSRLALFHLRTVVCVYSHPAVIVMTFWYVLGMDLTFSNFLNFIFTWD